MNGLAKFKANPSYTWVYLIGALLTLINGIFFQNETLSQYSLFVLYCVLFYKSVHVLIAYQKAEKMEYQPIDKQVFAQKYNPFRSKVLLFWLAFVLLCVLAKFVWQLDYHYFYSCTYFFLLLDRLFINVGCLLRFFSDTKKAVVLCCCGCPCRGWDLLMIHTPLLFALHYQMALENALIAVSSLLAALSMLCWEKAKYSFVVVKQKCAVPCNLSLCREYRP